MEIKIITIIILSLLNGIWMLIDGIHVIKKRKYIGPDKPGPWANLFYKLKIDVFKLGPLFITYGILWLIFIYLIITNQNITFYFGIILSLLTLWYIKVGTIISIIILILLYISKTSFGF